jgi:hypothetical protein
MTFGTALNVITYNQRPAAAAGCMQEARVYVLASTATADVVTAWQRSSIIHSFTCTTI